MRNKNANTESHLRSVLKGITWRVLATLTTTIIAYIVTRRLDVAVEIGAIEVVAKIIIYYLHERTWLLIPIGKPQDR